MDLTVHGSDQDIERAQNRVPFIGRDRLNERCEFCLARLRDVIRYTPSALREAQ